MVFGIVGSAALLIAAHTAVAVTEPLPALGPSVAAHQVAAPISTQQQAPAERVDLNRADEERLQTVPGIGPSTARRIIDWRNEHGQFERLEDLLNIRGIGVTTLEKLRPYVTVGAPGDSKA